MAYNISKEFLEEEYINKQRTLKNIAEELGCNSETIAQKLRKYGFSVRKQISIVTKDFVLARLEAGDTSTQIAQKLGVSIATVSKKLKEWGLRKTIKNTYLNKTFGYLTVIEILDPKEKQSHKRLRCLCECGKEIIVKTCSIATENTRSCGCKKWELKIRTNKYLWKGYKDVSGTYFSQIKNGAELRGLDFNITIEDMWDTFEIQNGKCALSGIEIGLFPRRQRNREQTASLDRIDPTKGYHIDNIQWVHKDINRIKQAFDNEYFIHLCKLVAANFNND